ncbi:MAG: hypothetical protein R3F11_11745 [Verrucomicrobiales bacterium]
MRRLRGPRRPPAFPQPAPRRRRQAARPHDPQQHFLSLIGTGDGSALATRAGWAAAAPLLWTLKDRIDRRFMRRFA